MDELVRLIATVPNNSGNKIEEVNDDVCGDRGSDANLLYSLTARLAWIDDEKIRVEKKADFLQQMLLRLIDRSIAGMDKDEQDSLLTWINVTEDRDYHSVKELHDSLKADAKHNKIFFSVAKYFYLKEGNNGR